MTKVAQQWTEQEFAGLDLGDARLNKRAKRMMEKFSANPTASIPDACDSWSETVVELLQRLDRREAGQARHQLMITA